MSKRRKVSQSSRRGRKSRDGLKLALDLFLILLAGALIGATVFGFVTRPTVPYSVSGEADTVKCKFQPILLFDGEKIVDRAPHLHLAATSLVVDATTVDMLERTPTGLQGTRRAPLRPEAFAFLSFKPEASIRVFMIPHTTMTLQKGGELEFRERFEESQYLPKTYSVALAFDYPKNAKVWTIMASQETDITAWSYLYGPRSPVEMEGALFTGYARPFLHAPVLLERGLAPPAMGQRATVKIPGGMSEDYSPLMLVNTPPEPLSGSPIFCESLVVTGPKGTLLIDGASRSIDGAKELSLPNTSAQLEFSQKGAALYISVRGISSSITLDHTQLVPTRAGRFGAQEPLITAIVGTLVAASIAVLFVTRGRIIRSWLKEDPPDAA